MAPAPDSAPDGAILGLWISVNKWISPGAAEKLREIRGGHGMNGAIRDTTAIDEGSRILRSG
jgi:hypothetical protein